MGVYSSQRAPGREHIPVYPKGFIAVRIIQLVLSLVVIGLSAFGLAYVSSDYLIAGFPGADLNIFAGIATLITTIYLIVADFGSPKIYNYWAVLSLDIFLLIIWLSSFAVMAAEVAPFIQEAAYYAGTYSCDGYTCADNTISTEAWAVLDSMAAVAGVGGLEFVLFIVSLSIHSVMLHRHRSAGLHCMPGQGATGAYAAPAALYAQQAYSVQTMTPPPQQQVYAMPQQQHVAQPTPYYPQQVPSPLQAQHTGGYQQVQYVQQQQQQ